MARPAAKTITVHMMWLGGRHLLPGQQLVEAKAFLLPEMSRCVEGAVTV